MLDEMERTERQWFAQQYRVRDEALWLSGAFDGDNLDGTTGELRRLTRHLLTLVVRYRGRVSLPRGRAPGERRWQVGIVGDMHTMDRPL